MNRVHRKVIRRTPLYVSCSRFSVAERQRGVALLTVLLIVVAITILAGSMVAKQRIALRHYELLQQHNQLIQDIQAANKVAVAIIKADARVASFDGKQDAWNNPITVPYADAGDKRQIMIQIGDESGKFNLNNLYHDGKRDEQSIAIFSRLLEAVGLEASLVYAVLDWQDPDNETSPEGGAEADAYLTNNNNMDSGISMRAQIGNQPFLSVDELVSVKGFDADAVAKLQPYLTAVPYYLPININTAEPEVLTALFAEKLNFKTFVEQVANTPAQELDDALALSPWSAVESESLSKLKPILAVESWAYGVLIDVTVNEFGEGQKHRYATSFISKLPSELLASPTAAATPNVSNNTAKSNDFVIQSFGLKLWSYRPIY